MGTSAVVRRAHQADGNALPTARENPFPYYAGLAAVLAVTALVRWRYLDIPFERDEGEFAYGGQLILAGEVPYQSMYAMKLPGIYLVYALFLSLFGETVRGIHLGLLVVNLAEILLVFAIAQKLFDASLALISALLFALLTFSAAMTGTLAQAEHFVLLPALAGALVLLRAVERPRWWLYLASGLLLGMALVIKQHGGAYLLFGLAFAATSDRSRWRQVPWKQTGELALLLLGGAFPLALAAAVIAQVGGWEPFVLWTFSYASEYIREEPLANFWGNLREALGYQLERTYVLWISAAIGLVAVVRRSDLRKSRPFTLWWLAASCLAILPGFYFRPHYFLFLTPSLAMLAAVGLTSIAAALTRRSRRGRPLGAAFVLGVLAWSLYQELNFALPRGPQELLRAYYPTVFADAPRIAAIMAEHSLADEPVAILGSEPELLFYSQRKSATGHIYMYPLMEPQPFALEMQRQAIEEIESVRPRVVVVCEFKDSWGDRPESNLHIMYWCQRYIMEHYDQVARIELMGPMPAQFRQTPDELASQPVSQSLVYVMRRKPSASDETSQVIR